MYGNSKIHNMFLSNEIFCLNMCLLLLFSRPYYFHFHAVLLKNKKLKHNIDDLVIWWIIFKYARSMIIFVFEVFGCNTELGVGGY